MRRGAGILACFLLALATFGCARGESPQAVAREIRAILEEETFEAPEDRPADLMAERVEKSLRRFYAKRQQAPAWGLEGRERETADSLVAALAGAAAEGLDPEAYGAEALRADLAAVGDEESTRRRDGTAERRLAELDVRLSRAFLRYGYHLMAGRLDPAKIGLAWYANPRQTDLAALLERAVAEGDAAGALASLVPPHPSYVELREALAHHRRVAELGGWPEVPATGVSPGSAGPATALLRARLVASGDLAGEAATHPDARWDDALGEAVHRFQRRLGLEETGEVDGPTRAALKVPVAARIRQIERNMERWRWLPPDLGARHVLVNIPAFELAVVEHGAPVLTMRVVVGKTAQQTPVFSDTMTYLVLNPYWNVPEGIAREEIVPALRRDPGYLAAQRMEVVRGWDGGEGGEQPVDPAAVDWESASLRELRFRQLPGPGNSLGRIKFMFPNEHDIYLHDTPAAHLFARAERSFSHGCIRLERPLDLAAHLLAPTEGWERSDIAAALATGARRIVQLPEPIPVHILYWTAWVGEDGALQLRDDVYGHDAALDRSLASRREPQPEAT